MQKRRITKSPSTHKKKSVKKIKNPHLSQEKKDKTNEISMNRTGNISMSKTGEISINRNSPQARKSIYDYTKEIEKSLGL